MLGTNQTAKGDGGLSVGDLLIKPCSSNGGGNFPLKASVFGKRLLVHVTTLIWTNLFGLRKINHVLASEEIYVVYGKFIRMWRKYHERVMDSSHVTSPALGITRYRRKLGVIS